MNSILKISVTPKSSKRNSVDEIPVYLRLTLNGQRTELSTQKWIRSKNWNPSLKRIMGPGAAKINNFLEEEISYIRSIKREFDTKGEPYSVVDIRNKYLGENIKSLPGLIEKYETHISFMENLAHISYSTRTIKHYKVTLNHLKQFIQDEFNKEDLSLDLVNHTFIMKFSSYLRTEKKHMYNTAERNLGRVKTIINECKADGLINTNPFARIKIGYKPSDKQALNEIELKLLINADFANEKLNRVKDIFVFCCLTGLSYIDVKNLQQSNLITLENGDQIVSSHRQKTNQKFTTYLLDTSKQILQKYKDHPVCLQKGVLLPVLSNQKMNDYLKVIAAHLEIDKDISCHIARYTFITTVAIANGISTPITAAMAGHSNTRMTDAYTKLTELEVVKKMKTLEGKY
jgi:integrase